MSSEGARECFHHTKALDSRGQGEVAPDSKDEFPKIAIDTPWADGILLGTSPEA
jgi:hypothetical protein